jgi:hypothetical protein
MRRFASIFAASLLAVALIAPVAQADFGLSDFEVEILKKDGTPATQAGSHPFTMRTYVAFNRIEDGVEPHVDGKIRDIVFEQVAGLTGDTDAVQRCTSAEFLFDECPVETVVGLQSASIANVKEDEPPAPVFNLTPPPGVALRLGWKARDIPIAVDLGIKQSPHYNALASVRGINQTLSVFSTVVELWGEPGDPAHDVVRGHGCTGVGGNAKVIEHKRFERDESAEGCDSNSEHVPFLTLPRSCQGPAVTRFEARSWQEPDKWITGSHTGPAFEGCGQLEFLPEIASRASTDSAGTSSGLEFELDFEDEVDHLGEGLIKPGAVAQSDMKKITVTLPPGVTANPSLAEGLGVCTPADLANETLAAEAGAGCPNASKVGTVSVESPLVAEPIAGSVFLAQQDDPTTLAKGAENPFDSLLALYVVIKDKQLGILVKQAGKIEPDPRTGQLVTTFGEPGQEIAQVSFTRLKFRFREGQRAPLITPSTCGTHETKAEIVPWARPSEVITKTASFQITRGVGGGPCPSGGVPPFNPGFEAGSLNNKAGAHSTFLMRLTRQDGQQDMTKFSATLPPGVTGKLAGVSECSNAQIANAKGKTGRAELSSPSCPGSSLIGHTLAGAGVGSALTFVPGSLYLAGPHKGAPLSVVAITPAVAGPFDVGTVVVRVALRVNPRTAEVEVDGDASDPIPHILKGIPLSLRDLRVSSDRPQFTLNPTSCAELGTGATLYGSFLDLFSPDDDVPIALRSRYQAADCAALPYRPRLDLRLKGGTKRGQFPAFRAVFRPRPDNANSRRLAFKFPRSAFLEQGHMRTICTRVQFAADACPKGSVYGNAVAFTPLLSEPLRGPVYLRSSDHELPDLVFDLHGRVDFEGVARVDSVRGAIRVIVEGIPDAPIEKVVVRMQGGQKGLIVNSRDICKGENRARIRLFAHNGRREEIAPRLRARCGRKGGKRKG